MLISLHKNATTTPAIRRAIQTSTDSTAELARQYGLALDTVRANGVAETRLKT